MTTTSFLLRAGISLAILSALPLFANANMLDADESATPVVATQDFSGAYSGTGQAADSNGWEAPCTSASISINDTPESVTLSEAAYECGSLGAHHESVQLLKKSDGLYLGARRVGAYSSTEIDAMLPFERLKDVSYVIRLLKKDEGVLYTEDWLSLQDGAYDQVFEMGSTLSPTSTILR